MDSLVILWQSNMETTHNYIQEERVAAENDNNTNKIGYNINKQIINQNSNYNIEEGNYNIDSAGFSNDAILAELHNKNKQEKVLNYKNKNFPVSNYDEEIDPKEHLAENLSRLFEKMVYQLEIVTR